MNPVKSITKYSLIKELNSLKNASKDNRSKVSKLVLKDQALFQSLIEIVFDYDNDLSVKASGILELVCEDRLDWIAFNLPYFTENLHKLKDDSAVRSAAKICNLIAQNYNSKFDSPIKLIITEEQVAQIIETCFDWLLSDYKVATKAHAMEALYYIGKTTGWIHYELKMIIEKNLPLESPGYVARAKKVLESISKNTAA
ncbi:MAG: adenylosuccinate lyase [Aureibaculum sp.]